MRREKKELLLDLGDERRASRQEAILSAGGRILRRRRAVRQASRSVALIAILAVAGFSALKTRSPHNRPVVATKPALPDQPKALSDEELLALFPNTPVALASLENGKKRLIFPKEGDEKRFLTRL